jgi:hypothetical protein
MSLLDDIRSRGAAVAAEYVAGGYEPDGIGLARGNPTPNNPAELGWGRDLSCSADCDENFSEVDPNSPQAVGEALFRRLTTPHGGLLTDAERLQSVGEDPDYGYNLARILSNDLTAIEIQAHSDLAAAEARKDDRIATCSVELIDRGQGIFEARVYGELKTGESYSQILPLNADTRGLFP